jgi:hypothetical protein
MDFRSLQHLKDHRSTCRELCLLAMFRLQGLVTLLTVSSLRSSAGFVSHRRRSWDSPFGAFPSRKVSGALPHGCTHIPFVPPLLSPPKRRAGPAGRGFWVLTLPRVPGSRRGFSTSIAGCSLGFRPSRVLSQEPRSGFRPTSSHALPRTEPKGSVQRRPRVSVGSRLASSEYRGKPLQPDKATLLGFLHRPGPSHSVPRPSGLCVHLIPSRSSLSTYRHSLNGSPGPTGVVGIGLGAEHLRPHRRTREVDARAPFRVFG